MGSRIDGVLKEDTPFEVLRIESTKPPIHSGQGATFNPDHLKPATGKISSSRN